MLHAVLWNVKAALRHQPLDGNKAWQGYLSLQSQRQNGISGVNEVCMTHITQTCSQSERNTLCLQKKRKKCSSFFCPLNAVVLSVMHENQPPFFSIRPSLIGYVQSIGFFKNRKYKKQNYKVRHGDVIYQRVGCCKHSSYVSFWNSLWSIVVLGALTFSSSALRPWQMQVSSVTRNQSSGRPVS